MMVLLPGLIVLKGIPPVIEKKKCLESLLCLLWHPYCADLTSAHFIFLCLRKKSPLPPHYSVTSLNIVMWICFPFKWNYLKKLPRRAFHLSNKMLPPLPRLPDIILLIAKAKPHIPTKTFTRISSWTITPKLKRSCSSNLTVATRLPLHRSRKEMV